MSQAGLRPRALRDVLGIAEMLGKGGVHEDGTVVFAVIASGACQS